MDEKKYFSTRLKALREEKGLNQTQLAKELKISRGSISFYENGDRTPDIEIFNSICKYFDVSYDYLLGKSDLKKSNIKIDAIREYTHLSDYNIQLLHEYKNYHLINMVNDILNGLLKNQSFVEQAQDYLFYKEMIDYSKELFYKSMCEKYNVSLAEDELGKLDISYRIFTKLSESVVKIYNNEEEDFKRSIQYIIDKKELLEYKISHKIIDEILGDVYFGGYYGERVFKFVEKFSLSDIISGQIITPTLEDRCIQSQNRIKGIFKDKKE